MVWVHCQWRLCTLLWTASFIYHFKFQFQFPFFGFFVFSFCCCCVSLVFILNIWESWSRNIWIVCIIRVEVSYKSNLIQRIRCRFIVVLALRCIYILIYCYIGIVIGVVDVVLVVVVVMVIINVVVVIVDYWIKLNTDKKSQ